MVEFQIVLDKDWLTTEDFKLKVLEQPKEVKEPINVFNKLKRFFGLKFKEKIVGYYYKTELV